MADTFAFDPNQRHNFDKWLASDDVTPQGLYQSLGISPGFGKYRSREELEPTFLDKLLDKFGVQTDRTKELKELATKQQALKPFAQQVLATKVADQVHRLSAERNLPKTTQDLTGPVARTLGVDQPPTMTANVGQLGAPTALQPAPNQQPAFGSEQPPMMLRPAPSLGDQVMAGMPLGTPGQMGAMSEVQPFAAPMQAGSDPLPFAPLEQTGMQNVPEFDPSTGGMRPGLQSVAVRNGPPMLTETVRDQPITMADRKVRPQPPPALPDRDLSIPERFQVLNTMDAQAKGGLMVDETGKLVPSSFMAPDQKTLTDEQQASLASIYQGGAPAPGVRLPAGPYMTALKGKQEGKSSDISQGVREYMAAHGMPNTPQSIEIARQSVRQERMADERKNIMTRELMQTTPQDVRAQLLKQGTNVLEATPEQIDRAIKDAADQELSVAARKKMQDFALSGLDSDEKSKLTGLQQVARVTHRLRSEFTPAERREFVGYFQLPLNRIAQIAKANPRFAMFDALVNREGLAAFDTAGKALTANESAIIFGFLPQGKEWSPENFEAKLREGDDYARSKIGDIVSIATTTRRDMGREMQKRLPVKEAKKSAAERFNELEKQGMKEQDIYNQLVVEGYK